MNDRGGFTRTELGLMSGAALLCAAVGFLLVTDFSFIDASMSAKGPVIAEIVSTTNNVKRRPSDVPLWSRATDRQSLYQRDHVFTDKDSSVRIAFGSEGTVEISENALVVIEQNAEVPTVRIQQGTLIAKTTSTRQLNVKVGQSSASISGNNATVAIGQDQKGQQSLTVIKGEARLETNGKTTDVKADQQLLIPQKAAAVPKVVELPRVVYANEEVFATGQAWAFSWTLNSAAPLQSIEISKYPSFENVLFRSKVTRQSVQTPILESGSYYVRIGVGDGAALRFSVPQQLRYLQLLKPRPVWPRHQSDLAFEAAAVAFDWTSSVVGAEYDIQVATESGFAQPVMQFTSTVKPSEARRLIPGEYFWRIRARYQSQASLWSAASAFRIRRAEIPIPEPEAAPVVAPIAALPVASVAAQAKLLTEILSPKEAESITLRAEQPSIEIVWRSVGGVEKYELSIARDPQFQDLALVESLRGTMRSFTPTRSGEYYVRVKPAQLPVSETRSFVVQLQPLPQALKLIALAPTYSYRGEVPVVSFQWKGDAKSVRFQLANSPEFTTIIDSSSHDRQRIDVKLMPGRYFARVSHDQKQWSPVAQVEVTDDLKLQAPNLIQPLGQELSYRTLEPNVAFRWQMVPFANRYRLEVFEDAQLRKSVFQSEMPTTQFTKTFKKGQYFWRTVALDTTTKKSTASTLGSFSVRQEVSQIEPKMPRPEMLVDFDDDEPRHLNFVWQQPADITDVRVVVAKDADFQSIVGRINATSNSIQLRIPSDGQFFWFVEGKDKVERVTLRSEVVKFRVKTTIVGQQLLIDQARRLEVAYNPSVVNYSHKGEELGTTTFKKNFTKSYLVAVRGWLTKSFGIDGEFSRRFGGFQLKNSGTSRASSNADAGFIDAGGSLRYRFTLFERRFPINTGLRMGYYFTQNLSFFALEDTDTGVQSSNFHHAATGAEFSVPFSDSVQIETKMDYLFLISSFPVEAKSSQHYVLSSNVIYQFLKHGILGWGIYIRKQSVKYRDPENDTGGRFDSSVFGMLYTIGWSL